MFLLLLITNLIDNSSIFFPLAGLVGCTTSLDCSILEFLLSLRRDWSYAVDKSEEVILVDYELILINVEHVRDTTLL